MSDIKRMPKCNLSATQRKIVVILSKKKGWISAYRLQIGLNTLRALLRKGCVECQETFLHGAFSSPQVMLQWRITDFGMYCMYYYKGKRCK